MIKFELDKIATAAEIAEERRKADKAYSLVNVGKLAVVIAGLLAGSKVSLVFGPFVANTLFNETPANTIGVSAITVLIAYAASFIAVVASLIGLFNRMSNRVVVNHNNLKKLYDTEIGEAIRYCERNPVLDNYRMKVAAERDFVRGDLALMQEFDMRELKAASERVLAASREEARTKLHSLNMAQDNTVSAGQLRSYAMAVFEEMNAVYFGEIMAAFEAEAENAGLAFVKTNDSGCEISAELKRQLGIAVLKAKMRHISPWESQANIDSRADALEIDGDGTKWAEGIIASLQKQGIAIVRMIQREPCPQVEFAE